MNGELQEAIDQLHLALAVPELLDIQRSRFVARMEQLEKYLPKRKRRRLTETG